MNFGNFDHDRDFVNFGSWTWICSFVSRTGISTVIVNFGILGFNNRGQNSRSWVQDFKFPKLCSLSIFTKLRSWSTFTKFVGVINIPEIHVRETNFELAIKILVKILTFVIDTHNSRYCLILRPSKCPISFFFIVSKRLTPTFFPHLKSRSSTGMTAVTIRIRKCC